ncbi:TMEM165/GDT1 family protein [Sphingomonas sp. MG17]|uniref:GDT1 family protein n=1 Tax=Sphingomonas tagetis TaxID=2949092 RepID=A0A9X2HU33_9SPHN|nr:TMEM165/GDT1 family protein [Sphingomonas tagetis]MCP3732650.1 TMEM165/GDT1 family protein [Sphingomonas tagetis]
MEALVPAFVAALLAQIGDRSPWLVAILADRYGKPFTIALAALFAHAAGNAIAGAGGALIAPMLTPNAKQLLIALALIFAASGALWRLKAPDRLERWRLGSWLTAFLGIFILALGDTTQFFTFAFAARGPSPWTAVVGATVAAFAVNLIAALMGEASWRRLPLHRIRVGVGVLALGGGAVLGVSALQLI